MVIGVLGGRGQVGRLVMREAARRGHRAIALSRTAPRQSEHRPLDVATGQGLPEALTNVEALVDVLDGGREVLVDGLARTLAAARDQRAGHVVSLSILGADRVPLRYYRTKLAQEGSVRTSGVPWTIVRATQFHWARAHHVRRVPLPVPAVGGTLRAVRAGGLTDPRAARGRCTFEAWLREAS